MTLLEELIFSLSKSERKKLRPLQFRGVKKKIFSRILKAESRAENEEIDSPKYYKLSANRYYQIHSEMLEACYHDLIPSDGTDLLLALGQKQLFKHYHHEMKKQEAALLNHPRELERYYFQVLLMRNLFLMNST